MNRTDRHHGQTRTDGPITDREPTTMADVSHTHPHADRGALNRLFERGPVVAADGGERNAASPSPESDDDEEQTESNARMKDVNHEPPYGEGVDRVFERGGKEEPVESEE